MERTVVQSSNILSIGYDERSRVLEIEFKKSGIYQYSDVPSSVYSVLMSAPSKGTYFDHNIKKVYAYQKV